MKDEKVYRNIEEIIKALKELSKCVDNFRKYDGITIECEVDTASRENAMNEIHALSKKINMLPVSIEARKDNETLFGVQYPELKPVYTEEEMKRMYENNFEFLFNNIQMKDPKSVTRENLLNNMERLTKHVITTYCRSNINQYKEKVEDYLDNPKYRIKINGWYLEYVDKYLANVK